MYHGTIAKGADHTSYYYYEVALLHIMSQLLQVKASILEINQLGKISGMNQVAPTCGI